MKKATTFTEQIKLLKKRGLKAVDSKILESFLNEVNYYRLTGYCKLYCRKTNKDKFVDGFTMNKLINIYKFDCRLRNIFNELIDSIEISVKTQIAYHLSNSISPRFYNDKNNFVNQSYFDEMKKVINTCIEENRNEKSILHYLNEEIPIWVLIEYLPIGAVSRMYSNLHHKYKKIISKGSLYSINYSYFVSYLNVLSYMRNLCAHRGRLYGRNFSCTPKFSNQEAVKLNINYNNYKCTLFMCTYIVIKLCPNINIKNNFINDLEISLKKYKDFISLNELGFPLNWKQLLIKSE